MRRHVFHAIARARGSMTHDGEHNEMRREVFLGSQQLECKQDLTSRLPPGVFIFPDAPVPPNTRMLVVAVLDAETDASETVTLQAAWTLQSGQAARATFTQQATLEAALENRSAAAQAAALSRVLGALADRIAGSFVAR